MRFVLNVMGEELNLMNEIERIIDCLIEADRVTAMKRGLTDREYWKPYAKFVEKILTEKRLYWEQDYADLKKEHKRCVIKARIEECQDWLDYFKAQDDDQRIYLLENHFEKRIAKLRKELNEK